MGIETPSGEKKEEKKPEGSIDDVLGWADNKLNHKEVMDLFKGIGEAAAIAKGVQDLVALVRINPKTETAVKDHLTWLKKMVRLTKEDAWGRGEAENKIFDWLETTRKLLAQDKYGKKEE